MLGRYVQLNVISSHVSHKPSHVHHLPPLNSKTPVGITLLWPPVALSSLTPTHTPWPLYAVRDCMGDKVWVRKEQVWGGGGSAAIERSTSSGNALKRQVLIWDFKCFSLWYIQLASEPSMGGEGAPWGCGQGHYNTFPRLLQIRNW